MIIYNVTMNIAEEVHEQWMQWIQKKHISDVMATGCFTSARLVKVLVNEEMGGITYSVQFFAPNKESLENFKDNHEDQLQYEGIRLFGDRMLFFKTDLEIISEY
jgi:hypothetical protein